MSELFTAKLKGARVSPRKSRLVVDLVRGMHVQEALDVLNFTPKKTAPLLKRLLNSAIANAKQKATVDVDNLVISKIWVDEGPTMKRFIPRAQGRATPIRKRTSNLTIKLKEL